MKPPFRFARGESLVSLGLLALGVYILVQVRGIAATRSYEQVGPRLFPALIGLGLVAFGAILGWQALTGGWRNLPADQDGRERPDWGAFIALSAAVILHMALIGSIGFFLASLLLFTLVARGFGSRRWLRDVGLGAILSAVAYYLFTLALGLHLPASPLGVI